MPNFGKFSNGTGREVEVHVARAPLLSLFRREEPVDGGDSEPYTLHNYDLRLRLSLSLLNDELGNCNVF